MDILQGMEVAFFKMAFDRFECHKGICTYLRSDAGSNFMGPRNIKEKLAAERLFGDVKDNLQEISGNALVREVNPPQASYFGGVWERAIRSV